jgi:hypothetical protein
MRHLAVAFNSFTAARFAVVTVVAKSAAATAVRNHVAAQSIRALSAAN